MTELPTVVHNTSKDLTLYCDDTDVKRMTVINTHIIDIVGFTDIDVYTDNEFTEPLFLPGSACMRLNSECMTLQEVYQFQNGK